MTPAPEADRGLQAERTSLAWLRTTLAFVAVVVLALRDAVEHRWAIAVVAGVAAVVVATGAVRRRVLQLAPATASMLSLATMAAAVVALAVVVMVDGGASN